MAQRGIRVDYIPNVVQIAGSHVGGFRHRLVHCVQHPEFIGNSLGLSFVPTLL